jgi:hypothetical protein
MYDMSLHVICSFISNVLVWFIPLFGLVIFGGQLFLIFCNWGVKKLENWRVGIRELCELFPLLGLAGTVASLIVTLHNFETDITNTKEILDDFGPALLTTLEGLIALIINLICNFFLGQKINRL